MADMEVDSGSAVIVPLNVMPLLDDTDFKAIETGLVYDSGGLVLTWNFQTTAGVMTSTAVTATTSGLHDISEPLADVGMYAIEIPASGGNWANDGNAARIGTGWFTGVATGILPWRGPFIKFRAAAINNRETDGDGTGTELTAIPWNASWDAEVQSECTDALNAYDPPTNTEMLAAHTTTDALITTVDTVVDAVLVDTGTTLDGLITTVDTVVDGLTTELAKVPKSDGTSSWNATALGAIQSECNDALVAQKLDHLVAVADADDAVNNSIVAKLASKSATADWSSYVNTTDSLEAQTDTMAAFATDADIADAVCDEALSGHTTAGTVAKAIADIETDATAILEDTATTIPGTISTMQGNVTDILTDTGTTLDGKIDTIDGIVDAILVDTGTTIETHLDFIDDWILNKLVTTDNGDGTYTSVLYADNGTTPLWTWTFTVASGTRSAAV